MLTFFNNTFLHEDSSSSAGLHFYNEVLLG